MTRDEAFLHFLNKERKPSDPDYLKVASWKNRYSKGAMTYNKMGDILLENGYQLKASEQWTSSDVTDQFVIIFREEFSIGVKRVYAIDEKEAFEMVKKSNRMAMNMVNVTNATMEAVTEKINDIIQFNYGN